MLTQTEDDFIFYLSNPPEWVYFGLPIIIPEIPDSIVGYHEIDECNVCGGDGEDVDQDGLIVTKPNNSELQAHNDYISSLETPDNQ